MSDYKIGGPLKQFTATEKTTQMATFLADRMAKAVEGNDAVDVHYLLATLDDYHDYMWRYYRRMEKEQASLRQGASD